MTSKFLSRGLILSTLFALALPAYGKKEERSLVGVMSIDNDSALRITSSPSLQERKLSEVFIEVQATNEDQKKKIKPLSFDADMPQHFHGMMVKPTAPERLDDDKNKHIYRVRGVKLHMPGEWRITVKVKVGDQERELSMPYQLNL
jgi:hypothetical protein